ncbi:MAG: hypothetical protein R3B13_21540 [Polyangiaceae bacterium]
MKVALWPIALRSDLVQAFRPGEPAEREGPFRTLRKHGWATRGVSLHIRQGGRASGQWVVFSALNLGAAICARNGDAQTALAFAAAAQRIEESIAFARLVKIFAQLPASTVSQIVEAARLPEVDELTSVVRALAARTERVRLQRRFAGQRFDVHLGRISSAAEGYVVVTSESGLSVAIPQILARGAHRERVGECLAVIKSQIHARELIVRAVPGVALDPELDKPYSPFDRVPGFEPINRADADYLRGQPVPLTIQVPVSIEQ